MMASFSVVTRVDTVAGAGVGNYESTSEVNNEKQNLPQTGVVEHAYPSKPSPSWTGTVPE